MQIVLVQRKQRAAGVMIPVYKAIIFPTIKLLFGNPEAPYVDGEVFAEASTVEGLAARLKNLMKSGDKVVSEAVYTSMYGEKLAGAGIHRK